VKSLGVAMKERDSYTYEHCGRVDRLSVALGKRCGLSAAELKLLHVSATFHDVGKIGIPDTVLLKPGPLNEEEWTIIKTHSVKSYNIMKAIDCDESVVISRAVRHHHERFDGNGYPDGLIGEAIPIFARILMIADSYDAMARRRVYAMAKPHRQIMAVLDEKRGMQHDPWLLDKFSRMIEGADGRRFRASDG
jgi:HD-GYP domain-containing protein (c-di-GMP phosphodiesterase class II)